MSSLSLSSTQPTYAIKAAWTSTTRMKIKIAIPAGNWKGYYKPKLFDYSWAIISTLQDNFEVLKTDQFFGYCLENHLDELVQNSIDSVNERIDEFDEDIPSIKICVCATHVPQSNKFVLNFLDNGRGFADIKAGRLTHYNKLKIVSTKIGSLSSLGGSGAALSGINAAIGEQGGDMYVGNRSKQSGACISLRWPLKAVEPDEESND